MAEHEASQRYIREQIQNARPEQLIVLLYDGAIRFLKESKPHAGDPDPYLFHELQLKAQRVIAELMGAVNTSIYPEMSKNLVALYEFMIRHLVQANIEKSLPKTDDVLGLLYRMRDTWKEAVEKAAQEAGADGSAVSAVRPMAKSALSFQA